MAFDVTNKKDKILDFTRNYLEIRQQRDGNSHMHIHRDTHQRKYHRWCHNENITEYH